jgi:hypothetical protein
MKTREEIEQLAENLYFHVDGFEEEISEGKRHYILGYTQCQEDMADKKYTEDDIKETAYFFVSKKLAANQGILDEEIQDFINSLNKQD